MRISQGLPPTDHDLPERVAALPEPLRRKVARLPRSEQMRAVTAAEASIAATLRPRPVAHPDHGGVRGLRPGRRPWTAEKE